MLNELNEVQSRKAGKTEKMSFKNIKDVLSRDEMKAIMAGSGGAAKSCTSCNSNGVSYGCEYTEGVGGRPGSCTCSSANNDGTGCKITG